MARSLQAGMRGAWRHLVTFGQTVGAGAVDLAFPAVCLDCGAEVVDGRETPLCEPCLRRIEYRPMNPCRRCAAAVSPGLDTRDGCPLCRPESFRFDRAVAVGLYEGHVRELVLRIKHPHEEPLAQALADLLAQRVREMPEPPPIGRVVPVPMHWWRRLVRGTNSADVLAERVAKRLKVPFSRRMLRRRRSTLPQGSLSPRQRRLNVRGALQLTGTYDLKETHVLLVDDILTTGETCNEVARVLKSAGAASVTIALVARAGIRLHEGRRSGREVRAVSDSPAPTKPTELIELEMQIEPPKQIEPAANLDSNTQTERI